ncbi:MAG: dihydrodipicolinate synthase family protein, partial [Planctomycetales bacterium]|nr:dihydrodipicolinate synthase family protein [Planctomycetales bacterium]
REIDWALAQGADGVVVAMVSELLRMGPPMRNELAVAVVDHVAERGTTIISVGAESTEEACEYARHAEAIGAHAVMAIPPVATRLGPTATMQYFAAIASTVAVPLVVQDASSYVGASIDVGVYLELLRRFGAERIYFKPEASPLGPNVSLLRDASGGSARIFEGSGGIQLVNCFRRGIVGTMPGTDLLDAMVALWRALQAGDDERIYQIAFPLGAMVALQMQAGLDGFLAIEKYLLLKRGIFTNVRQRQPTGWQMDPETQAEVDRLFTRLLAVL